MGLAQHRHRASDGKMKTVKLAAVVQKQNKLEIWEFGLKKKKECTLWLKKKEI